MSGSYCPFFGADTRELDDGYRIVSTDECNGGQHISAYDDPVIACSMIVLAVCGDAASTLYDVPTDSRVSMLVEIVGGEVDSDATAQ